MKLHRAFDLHADGYDEHFTGSATGQAQRRQVWRALGSYIQRPLDILEVNCGTGEDALRLARLGHRVVATDISKEMIRICKAKLKEAAPPVEPVFQQAGFLELERQLPDRTFDLVFSNFGGLNCCSPQETQEVAARFDSLLKPGGRLFLVYMSRNCWWDKVYFTLKREPRKACRRQSDEAVQARVGGQMIDVWYYSPKELKSLYGPRFRREGLHPVGLLTPPSYLEYFFQRRKRLLDFLEKADRLLDMPALADHADHFAVVFRKVDGSGW